MLIYSQRHSLLQNLQVNKQQQTNEQTKQMYKRAVDLICRCCCCGCCSVCAITKTAAPDKEIAVTVTTDTTPLQRDVVVVIHTSDRFVPNRLRVVPVQLLTIADVGLSNGRTRTVAHLRRNAGIYL